MCRLCVSLSTATPTGGGHIGTELAHPGTVPGLCQLRDDRSTGSVASRRHAADAGRCRLRRRGARIAGTKPRVPHRPLCTIELIAEGHADRCPGAECAFWDTGCALTRIEAEVDGRPEVAALLLDLRRQLEAGREIEVAEAQAEFHRRLAPGRE